MVKWSEVKEIIIKRYKSGESLRTLARDFGVSHSTICKYLSRWGIERRNSTARQRHNVKNLVSQQFGHLTVLAQDLGKYPTRWLCRCTCGKTVSVLARSLVHRKIKSCGCKRGKP